MSILEIQHGKRKDPFSIAVVGTPGVGKTTFAAQAPKPIFIGAEETGELDVSRFPKPNSFKELMAQVDHISGLKDYKTVVVDTIDSVEQIIHRELLAQDPKQTGSMVAAHGGYGKAYDMAANKMLEFRTKLEALRNQGQMNLIFLAHSKKAQATDTILGMVYDTYEMAMHAKSQSIISDYVSAVFFATYIVHQQTGANTDKIFALGEGERVLFTEKRPGHIGKNRFNLPYEMPLDFAVFQKAYDDFFASGQQPSTEAISATVTGLAENIQDPVRKEKAIKAIAAAAGNAAKLAKIETKLREIIQ